MTLQDNFKVAMAVRDWCKLVRVNNVKAIFTLLDVYTNYITYTEQETQIYDIKVGIRDWFGARKQSFNFSSRTIFFKGNNSATGKKKSDFWELFLTDTYMAEILNMADWSSLFSSKRLNLLRKFLTPFHGRVYRFSFLISSTPDFFALVIELFIGK